MIVKWEPYWYELDQCIVVGDIDFFYLRKDNLYFANGLNSESYEREVKAEILKMTHPELGDIRGIITIGLDYCIYLSDGTVIIVNAEENPGETYDSHDVVSEWCFDVQIRIIEKTELPAMERKERWQECIRKYKALLGLSEADWES